MAAQTDIHENEPDVLLSFSCTATTWRLLMLDTFRKRDNVRPTTGSQPGVRPTAPNLAHAPNAPLGAAAPRVAPAPVAKPAVQDAPLPAAQSAPAEPVAPAEPEATAAAAEHAPGAAPSVARLTVGPDIKLKGAEITDCDTLIVEGQVDASMDSRVVEIAESGVFRGKVQVDVADIRGRFDGELTAHKQLVIRETGRVSGTIRYGKIRIDEGGVLSGDVAAAGK
jgi:cytoskeletal protein CcmA (bactofilin family)